MNDKQKIALWVGVVIFALWAVFGRPQPQVGVSFLGFVALQPDYTPYEMGLGLIALFTVTSVLTLGDRKRRD